MRQRIKSLNLNNVRITDKLFGEYVERVYEKIIPHQWNILNDRVEDSEPSYCIENFRVAAGDIKGERRGVVFLDTDLYKWLESVAFCLAGGNGKEYEAIADEVIELVGRAQEKDGYLNTYYTVNAPKCKWTNLVEGHELYTSGHMIEAAVAYFNATGKDRFLNIAKKNADLICSVFGRETGKINGYPGHQEIELALVKLYRATGDKKYLEQARYFIDERGKGPNYLREEMARRGGPEFFPEFKNYDLQYSQAHMRPIHQKTAEGHAVRAMYMCAAMADLAQEYDDNELQKACIRLWDNVTNKRMYITGGIGSSGFRERFSTDYDLPNNTNYSESCASIGLMMFGQRMNSLTGDAGYYDTVELALYNTVMAGINIAGDRYFYVNPLEVVPQFCTEHTYMDHVKPVRQKWFSVACCPPNIARTLASLGQYIYSCDENSLYINQFISSQASTDIGHSQMFVDMSSKLLQTGIVNISVIASGTGTKLKVRVPHYATKVDIVFDGGHVICDKGKVDSDQGKISYENGYIVFELKNGENIICIDFGVKPRWVATNDEVRADIGKYALMKGPAVYCLEEADNGKLLSNIYIDENTQVSEKEPVKGLVGDIPSMEFQGIKVTAIKDQTSENYQSKDLVDENALYRVINKGKGFEREEVTLKAIPYCMWGNRGEGEMQVWQKVRI